MTIECRTCKENKTPVEFTKDRQRKTGHSVNCKACARAYRKKNKVAIAERDKKYRQSPRARYKKYQYSAKSRGFLWELSLEEFMNYWRVPCVWCGGEIKTIGLDRVDPEEPYREGNIEPCCKHCNRMKSDLTSGDFIAHTRKIVHFRRNDT